MILYKFPFGPLSTNALLLGCSKTKACAVIDPSYGSTDAILERMEKEQLLLEKILLTHSHWDHIADVSALKQKSSAPVYVHSLDAKNLEHPGSDGIPLFFAIPPIKPDGFLKDGDLIELGKLKMEVIHTPGHSPGSVCFYLREQKLLLSGDTLFKGAFGSISLPTGQPSLMKSSLEKLAALPPDTRVVPGHGGETLIRTEQLLQRSKQL